MNQFQSAEQDIKALTGIEVSHSTFQRLVQRQEFEEPQVLARDAKLYAKRYPLGVL